MTKPDWDQLRSYRGKRDFARTGEPSGAGEREAASDGLAFVVHKHDATRLHYDFRIEWDGVLKSWAVTRGPSLDPKVKRLAVRVEDHPLDYGDFEGIIPAGGYGGGTVMLWDRGTWEPEGEAEEGLANGRLRMRLRGEKMQGGWALVRMKPRAGDKRENWLLIKERDEAASADEDLLAKDRSVKTGRTMEAIADGKKARAGAMPSKRKTASNTHEPKRNLAAQGLPDFRPVQLATLVDEPPSGDGWLHEMKHDGYRVLLALKGGRARFHTRNGEDWTERFARLVPDAEALSCDNALIDGEVVAFDPNGRTDFSTLQKHLHDKTEIACFCFDLLMLDGEDLTEEPLRKRKEALRRLIRATPQSLLRFSEDIAGRTEAAFAKICEAGHEGIVAKHADAPYRPGRNTDWLKIKCTKRQEFVIGGFSPSDKPDRAFSSILIGIAGDDGKLRYRGRVGSGFDRQALVDLAARFAKSAAKASPFASLPRDAVREARFVKPELVAEIDFTELTADGVVRHGVFLGLREDKPARMVTGEGTVQANEAEGTPAEDPTDSHRRGKGDRVMVAGIGLSHADRVVFAEQNVTKLDLAEYYEAVAPRMLDHVGHRALSLIRCPGGNAKRCFFQQHGSAGFPNAVRHVRLPDKSGRMADHLFVKDAAGLVAMVQMNVLEFHVWGSRIDQVEKPDRLVFDLDPDPSVGFKDVARAAAEFRDALEHLGLESFAMVTGGKGVHVVMPLQRRQGWTEVGAFAEGFAASFAEREPTRFLRSASKEKRRGLIFIDWLRNGRGQTAVAPYSTRSRENAPVATPVSWAELADLDAGNGFRIEDVLKRLEAADPWKGYDTVRQSITKAMLRKFDKQ